MSEQEQQNEQQSEKEGKTFEAAMDEMEKIVERLEQGDVPLEEAIDLFQKGMTLSKTCNQKLKKVEEKMDQILQEDGNMKEFHLQEDDTA